MRVAFFLILLLMAIPQAHASNTKEIPEQFHGQWVISGCKHASFVNCLCVRSRTEYIIWHECHIENIILPNSKLLYERMQTTV